MDTRDDAELLTEFAAKGSHAAFAALVSRHGPMAHGIATRVLSSHHDAQDVTQAVFILLARDARKRASSPSVAGWIHTVTRRLALNAHKSRAHRQRREHTAMEHVTTTTPLNLAQDASFRRELDAAIARLPERHRQPLLLVHLEGAPMDEVAKRLALHPDTLRTRLSRARGKLRELLGQRGVEIASVTVLSSFLTNELKELRKDLGMDISDEAYRKAIAAYGYQIDTDALFFELVKQWNSEDPRAATLWVSRMHGLLIEIDISITLAAWLIKDKAAAMAFASDF